MNKEEILIALKEIHARYCIPASEQNYTDKDYACMQYEKLVIHLSNQLDRLNNIINELEKYIHNELVLDFYNDDMPCELIINKMEKMIKELKEKMK